MPRSPRRSAYVETEIAIRKGRKRKADSATVDYSDFVARIKILERGVTEVKTEVKQLAEQIGAMRSEMAQGFAASRTDIEVIKAQTAAIKETVEKLPDHWAVAKIAGTVVTASVGLLVAAFTGFQYFR